ncbi:hypothetical protein BFS14_14825 [Serratia fonticola]|nr:hypothetical protein BFS14_14825 [Serratia fonticola]
MYVPIYKGNTYIPGGIMQVLTSLCFAAAAHTLNDTWLDGVVATMILSSLPAGVVPTEEGVTIFPWSGSRKRVKG